MDHLIIIQIRTQDLFKLKYKFTFIKKEVINQNYHSNYFIKYYCLKILHLTFKEDFYYKD